MNPSRRILLKSAGFLAALPFGTSAIGAPADLHNPIGAEPGTLEGQLTEVFDDMRIADSHEHIIDAGSRPHSGEILISSTFWHITRWAISPLQACPKTPYILP